MTEADRPSGPTRPPSAPTSLLNLLLGLAFAGMVGSWNVEGTTGRLAGGLASGAILAAFAVGNWRLGRRPAPAMPESGPSPGLDLRPVLDRLDRIAAALEARPTSAVAPEPVTAPVPSPVDLSAVGRAIADRDWATAESLLAEVPDHPEAPRLAADLAAARATDGDRLADELKAAQGANDPDRVLEIRDAMAATLPADDCREVDAELVKWFLALIMRRLRAGSVRPDVADLAAKVADRFARTVEGASLRASLPTLRRGAGLCPRCARPYRGIADACPICLAPPPSPPPADPAPPDWPDDPAAGA